MPKKRFLLPLALLLLSSTVKADDGVLLQLADGSTVGFAFSEKPVLVTGDSLLMKTTSQEIAYPYSDIKRVVFGEVPVTPDAIERVNSEPRASVSFRINNGEIEVSGLQRGERVSVYGINGALTASSVASSDDASVSLQLAKDGSNVYIVRTSSGKSFKFTTK